MGEVAITFARIHTTCFVAVFVGVQLRIIYDSPFVINTVQLQSQYGAEGCPDIG